MRRMSEIKNLIKRKSARYLEDIDYNNQKYFENFVSIKNGLYDLKNKRLHKHDPAFITFAQLPIEYNENAQCPNILKFLSEVLSPEFVEPALRVITYCLLPGYGEKVPLCIGGGANGKSTFFNVVIAFLGRDNTGYVARFNKR
jgi:putative DNA primase/helicase